MAGNSRQNGNLASVSRRRLLSAAIAAPMIGRITRAQAETAGVVLIGKEGWLFELTGEFRYLSPEHLATTTSLINSAVASIKAAGIEVVICLNPSKGRVYQSYLPDDNSYTPTTARRYAMALEALSKPGTLVPDIAAAFQAARAANPDTQYFFKSDTHWTPAGAELAATTLCAAIKAKAMLPPSPTPGTALGETLRMVQGANDLASQLPDALRTTFLPERYTIRKATLAGPSGLLAPGKTDTAIVGNSYMQPKYGFADQVSNQLARPVALKWEVHSYGSYKIMLDYLQSTDFKENRPKLLIWDFHEIDMEFPPESKGFWHDFAMPNAVFLESVKKAVG